jgi:hypothetical protein
LNALAASTMNEEIKRNRAESYEFGVNNTGQKFAKSFGICNNIEESKEEILLAHLGNQMLGFVERSEASHKFS